MCNWSQVNEGKPSERMGPELVEETFHTSNSTPTSSLKCMEIECGGADAERIAVAKTNSKSSTFKKDIFTLLN